MQCPPRGASGGAPDPIEEGEGLWDSMGLLGGLQHPWIWGCSAGAPVRSCCEMGGQKLKEHVDMGGMGSPLCRAGGSQSGGLGVASSKAPAECILPLHRAAIPVGPIGAAQPCDCEFCVSQPHGSGGRGGAPVHPHPPSRSPTSVSAISHVALGGVLGKRGGTTPQ